MLDQTDGSARGWLFTVARRIVIDDWRATRHQRELVTAELPENPVSDGADERVNSAVVTAALRRLSTEHRQVLLECYYRGSSVAQAATRLGIPVGTVKSRTHYALHALQIGPRRDGRRGMTDDEFATYDAAYLLGALSDDERRRFEDHLLVCDSCAESVRSLRGLPALLATVPPTVLEEKSRDSARQPVTRAARPGSAHPGAGEG